MTTGKPIEVPRTPSPSHEEVDRWLQVFIAEMTGVMTQVFSYVHHVPHTSSLPALPAPVQRSLTGTEQPAGLRGLHCASCSLTRLQRVFVLTGPEALVTAVKEL